MWMYGSWISCLSPNRALKNSQISVSCTCSKGLCLCSAMSALTNVPSLNRVSRFRPAGQQHGHIQGQREQIADDQPDEEAILPLIIRHPQIEYPASQQNEGH